MKIVIDARCIRPGRTGIGYYVESMLRSLDAIAGSHQIRALILETGEMPGNIGNIQFEKVGTDYESHPAGEFFELVQLPRLLRKLHADIVWGPAHLIPWVQTQARKVVTLHDLTVFTHPDCYPARFATYMRFVIKQSVRHADAIVCVSEATAADLRRIIPTKKARIEVIHEAADSFFIPDSEAPRPPIVENPQPYVLVLGGGDPRKNVPFLIRAFESALDRANLPHQLIIVGSIQGRQDPGPVAHGRIHRVQWLSRDVLRNLYRHADLLVMPSLYEGFGLPMLEAMACGCPVAASHAGALPEIGGSAVEFFDPVNEDEAVEKISSILNSYDTRTAMREAGLNRASEFSWASSARHLLHLFEELAG